MHVLLFVISPQVRSIHRHLWDGLLCCSGATWISRRQKTQVQVSCWNSAQGHQGRCHEMVPGQIRGCHPQQIPGCCLLGFISLFPIDCSSDCQSFKYSNFSVIQIIFHQISCFQVTWTGILCLATI